MSGFSQRPLTADDIDAAVALSTEPGWNQVAADWALMIEQGDSFGVFDESGALVASGLTVPYSERFGWISMILVTARCRRQGLATELMRQCMDALLARGLAPALDATPEGRQVYLPLGFKDIYRLTRLFAEKPSDLSEELPPGVALRPMEAGDLDAVVAYDTRRCGAGRDGILRHLHARLPDCAWVAEADGRLAGYALARDGRTCTQVGPVLAEQEQTAIALTGAALSARNDAACIDVGDAHEALIGSLVAAGFAPQFPFIRMIHDRSEPFDDPQQVFAIAGPELG